MGMRNIFLFSVLCVLLAAACNKPAETPVAETPAEPEIAAKVGAVIITEKDATAATDKVTTSIRLPK